MKEVTILELLRAKGLESQIHNSRLTREVAKRLREKGYIRVRRHKTFAWVKGAAQSAFDIPQMADRIVEDL